MKIANKCFNWEWSGTGDETKMKNCYTESNRARDLDTDLASTAPGVLHPGLFGLRHLDLQDGDSQHAVNTTHISSSSSSCCRYSSSSSPSIPPSLPSSLALTMSVLSQLLLLWHTLEDDLLDSTLCFSGVWDLMAWIRPLLLLCANDPSLAWLRKGRLRGKYAVRYHDTSYHWCPDL